MSTGLIIFIVIMVVIVISMICDTVKNLAQTAKASDIEWYRHLEKMEEIQCKYKISETAQTELQNNDKEC